MNKKNIIILVSFVAFLLIYPRVLKMFYPNYDPAKVSATTAVKQDAVNVSAQKNPETISIAKLGDTAAISSSLLSPGDDVYFRNKNLELVFNKKDAGIRQAAFKEFVDSDTTLPIRLFSLRESKGSTASVDILDLDMKAVAPKNLSQVQIASNSVRTISQVGALKITKDFTFDNSYGAKLNVRIENTSSKAENFYSRIYAGSSVISRHSIDHQYIESNFYKGLDQKDTLKHIREAKIGKRIQSQDALEWIAIKDRHFGVVLKPAQKKFIGIHEGLGETYFNTSLLSDRISLDAGASVTQEYQLYIGPNELALLEPYKMDAMINFGKLDGIGRFLVGALEILQKVFKNYGLSIIALTAIINLVLFPLTRISFMSMKRMQMIQPQITRLREQYKNSPEKLNRETMELYKKHKVNPFAGCLPLLLQMPVFIALYVALCKTVPLINAKFLWVKDLSSPDAVPLPFTLPFLGSEIHVLPLIMVAGMVFQQRISQMNMENQDPAMAQQQKMMAIMMPIIFGFVFYTMPSGLVLYWLTNTVIMTSYQLYLKKVTIS